MKYFPTFPKVSRLVPSHLERDKLTALLLSVESSAKFGTVEEQKIQIKRLDIFCRRYNLEECKEILPSEIYERYIDWIHNY